MAIARKNLAQSAPLAATLTDAYTVPASTTAVVTTITIANRSATATSFRIAHAKAGAADATSQYLYYDVGIDGNDTIQITTSLPMATTDVLRVYATLATLTFNVHGDEIS